MQAVMYHYVRPDADRPPYNYYYLDIEDFRRQLDYFEENYDLIERGRFMSYVDGDGTPSSDELVLTFDDGLSDHYEWVLPELRKRDLWGLFFVPGPTGENLLPVHRIHSMLGSADPDELATALETVIQESADHDTGCDDFDEMYGVSDADVSTRWFKRTLNYYVPYDRLPSVLENVAERVGTVPTVEPEEFYMTREEIRALSDAGMLVGGHTVSHPVLSRLSPEEQRVELEESLEFVRSVADPPVRTFAYPYGRTEVFDDSTIEILREADCAAAFTTETGDISKETMKTSPLRIPRFDCNEYRHGCASTS